MSRVTSRRTPRPTGSKRTELPKTIPQLRARLTKLNKEIGSLEAKLQKAKGYQEQATRRMVDYETFGDRGIVNGRTREAYEAYHGVATREVFQLQDQLTKLNIERNKLLKMVGL